MELPRKLHDFYVKLVATGAGYTSLVQSSPAGQGEGSFIPPVRRTALERLHRELGATIRASGRSRDVTKPPSAPTATDLPRVIGEELGKGFFTGQVELLHAGSRGAAHAAQEGLRFSIHLNLSDPDIAWLGHIPWELIRHEDQYLLLDPYNSLARCIDLAGLPPPPHIRQPLKVLVILANPRGFPKLAAESEYRGLDQSFRNSPSVQVSLLEGATPEALGKRLRDEAFHLMHFVGHAAFSPESGKGRLLLETSNGAPNPIGAEQFAHLLRGKATPQLVVLNACETASFSWRDGHTPWSGLATALLRARFPAVVAMQFPITDKAAVAFSRGFYGLLAAGHPVDIAIAGGRQAIFLNNPNSLEWATPVLYLRGMEGNIFRMKTLRPKQRRVVIRVIGGSEVSSPRYEDTLVGGLAAFLKIAPSDVAILGTESEGKFALSLPAEAANRLLEAAKSSEEEFEHRRAELSIASVKVTPGWISPLITFGLGILGNLIAALIQDIMLRSSFMLPRIAILLLLTALLLHWDLFERIRRKFATKRVIGTLAAGTALLVMYALVALPIPPPPNCEGREVSRVEVDLPTTNPWALSLSEHNITEIDEQYLEGIQRLSGRAFLSNGEGPCRCEWSGKTDLEEDLTDLSSSADCDFTIDLSGHVSWIYLHLEVGDKAYLFVIRVQRPDAWEPERSLHAEVTEV